MARPIDDGVDNGNTAHDPALAQDRRQALRGIDAVLDRNDSGFRPDQGLDERAGGLQIPELRREDDVVHRSDLCWIVGRFVRVQMEAAAHAVDPQAVLLDGGDVRAAGDEGDVCTAQGKCDAKGAAAAAAAGANDNNAWGGHEADTCLCGMK